MEIEVLCKREMKKEVRLGRKGNEGGEYGLQKGGSWRHEKNGVEDESRNVKGFHNWAEGENVWEEEGAGGCPGGGLRRGWGIKGGRGDMDMGIKVYSEVQSGVAEQKRQVASEMGFRR